MKRKTIRNHKDFYIPLNGLVASCACFVLRAKPARIPGDARYGIIVTKKVFKLAVERNRAKRLVRNWLACYEDLMNQDLDYVFILRSAIIDTNRDTGHKDMKYVLKKISKIYKENEQNIA